jgi:curved DNA-binding protein CbpA
VQESANLLGISTNSDKKKIKSAYLEKAKLYHPDVQATGNAQKFKNLSIAQA